MDVVLDNLDVYVAGFTTTVKLTLAAAAVALVLGTLVAAMRVSPVPPLRAAGTLYVNVVRNTPLTVVFFLVVFGLPQVDTVLSFFQFGVLALSVYTAPFVAEAVRSGINSVPAGQAEACRAVGMTFTQTLRLVVLPQAFANAVPPLASVFIALLKNTSIASAFFLPRGAAAHAGAHQRQRPGGALDPGRHRRRLPGPRADRQRAVRPARAGAGGGPMSETVLYDVQGPQAKRRVLIGSVVGVLLLAALVFVAVQRLADNGQFEAELYEPFWEQPALYDRLLEGLKGTLTAAAYALVLASVLGVLLAFGRLSKSALVRVPSVAVIELFRALPLLLVILGFFLAWPIVVGSRLDPLYALVIGLTLYNGAVIAEIVRAGIQSLPRGQSEAAMSIGLGRGQTLRLVLLPQAVRIMLPALISQLVVLLKDTSLGFVISYLELLRSAQRVVQVLDNPLQLFTLVALVYVLINLSLSYLATVVERRQRRTMGKVAGAQLVDVGRAPEPGPRRRRPDGGGQVRPRHRARPGGRRRGRQRRLHAALPRHGRRDGQAPARRARGVPHHLLDVWPVTVTATAAAYQALCRQVVDDLLARGVVPVLVGGSGLYLRAALDDLRFPGTDPELRASLEACRGVSAR